MGGDIRLAVCLSVSGGCIFSETAVQIWLKFCTETRSVPDSASHIWWQSLLRGLDRGVENVPLGSYCVNVHIKNRYIML